MALFSWLRSQASNRSPKGRMRRRATMPRCHLQVEVLECRTLLSTYYTASASDLIADINAANKAGGANTIVLTLPISSPYVLGTVDNTTDGPTGTPVISKKDSLTIVGNGDTIERSTVSGTLGFRLFDVASGGSLTLENVTLQNGEAQGAKATGSSAEGGAIYNQGTLVLSAVTVQSNTARGSAVSDAGGGIWSNGSLTMENSSVIAGNSASAVGTNSATNAYGGGIYITAGTANITGTTFVHNEAQGGTNNGGSGGSAYGGAIYIAGGTVTLNADIVGGTSSLNSFQEMNSATGGSVYGYYYGNGYGGGVYVAGGSVTFTNDVVAYNQVSGVNPNNPYLYGGGIYIASGATFYFDSFTVSNTYNNTDYSYYGGPFISDIFVP
jgi:hypothetical protein